MALGALRPLRPLRPLLALLAAVSMSSSSSSAAAAAVGNLNVLGTALRSCAPAVGYFRDGFCRTDASDHGRHVVAAVVDEAFLAFTASRGNDLVTPRGPSFPGLVPGSRWCLCVLRWREALEAGVAPPVDLEATHASALKFVALEDLKAHAFGGGAGGVGGGELR